MFSLTFTRVSEERERDLIRFNSFLPFLLAWMEPQQTNKQTNKSQIQRETKGEVADKFLLYDVLHASASISCAIKLTSSLD
jgi:hypothetical protein